MNADLLRLAAVLGLLALLLGLQWRVGFRRDMRARVMLDNLAVALAGSGLLRVLVPVGTVGTALWAQAQGIGLFPALALDGVAAIMATVVLMDLAIWSQHVASHRWPWLWRLHRVHHVATRFEATLGLRFHPLEILVSLGWKLLLVVALGLPAAGIALYETLLALAALWTHADLALPPRLERALRWLVVTPYMHRIHHSVHRAETDSNFSFHLSLWDRLFGSYVDAPRDGHAGMAIGLHEFRAPADQTLPALLLNPFRDPPATGRATEA